jgi:hypothetical protein
MSIIKGLGPVVMSDPKMKLGRAELYFGLYQGKGAEFDNPEWDYLEDAGFKMLELYNPGYSPPTKAIEIRKWIEKHLGYENIKGKLRVISVHHGETVRIRCYDKYVFISIWQLFKRVEEKYYDVHPKQIRN